MSFNPSVYDWNNNNDINCKVGSQTMDYAFPFLDLWVRDELSIFHARFIEYGVLSAMVQISAT